MTNRHHIRYLLISLLCFLLAENLAAATGMAQRDSIPEITAHPDSLSEEDVDIILDPIWVQPEYPGGIQALLGYLSDSVRYPAQALKDSIQGRVVCRFFIHKDGSITDIEVARSSGNQELDNEALRLLQAMPDFVSPGGVYRNGVIDTIATWYTVPVNFQLPK